MGYSRRSPERLHRPRRISRFRLRRHQRLSQQDPQLATPRTSARQEDLQGPCRFPLAFSRQERAARSIPILPPGRPRLSRSLPAPPHLLVPTSLPSLAPAPALLSLTLQPPP